MNKNEMNSLTVYLTSSKYTDDTELLFKLNLPICVASMGMFGIGFTPQEMEISEHEYSILCKQMAKFVKIDSKLKTVKVFDDESLLVDYKSEKENKYAKEFFQRWEETQMLLFEFQVFNLKENMFTLKGLWEQNTWRFLEIMPTNKFFVAEP